MRVHLKRVLGSWNQVARQTRCAPLPLVGRGWGWGSCDVAMLRPIATLGTVVLLAFALATAAWAQPSGQSWPQRPIKMIIPFPAGGGTDFIARLAAKHLSDRLGQQVFVENRGGANGAIGVQALMQADPDGYTIGAISDGPMIVNPALYPNNPYQPLRDFIGVGQMIKFPSMLVANPGT